MKRLGVVTVLLCACLCGRTLLANGGGYSFGVKFTGALAPFQASGTENVRILDEKLEISLRRTDAAVVVRYTMRNQSKDPVTVKFGFPVEAQKTNDFEEEIEASPKQRLIAAIQQLKGYSVRMNGKEVPAEFLFEPFAAGKIPPFPGSEALHGIAGWMVSQVVFPAAASRSLEIRYSADYEGDVTGVSDDYHASPLMFRYRLSTGGVWLGSIGSGSITIKADGIPGNEIEILKPDHRFQRKGDSWQWTFGDLEPSLADDITITTVPSWDSYPRNLHPESSSQYAFYLQHLEKWAEGHQRFKAVASSSLRPKEGHTYGPDNLAKWYQWDDRDFPWCEGAAGRGVGEYVEITPLEAKPMLAIGLHTGFFQPSKTDLFTRNGRPSRVEIILNGERRFSATLGDRTDEQLIPVDGYHKPVSKVRIVLKDTYAGTQFPDTCISKVILYDLLTKNPEVKPAR